MSTLNSLNIENKETDEKLYNKTYRKVYEHPIGRSSFGVVYLVKNVCNGK